MNIEWLYNFLETSRQQSLLKASVVLNMTQPALSKQIRQLENHLGVTVFRRSSSGVELTKEGQMLCDRIVPILNEYESLTKDLLNLSQLNTFRMASLPSLATHYLPQKITNMRNKGIQIKMDVYPTSVEIIRLLHNGTIDIGIVQKDAASDNTISTFDLFSEPFYVVIPKTHHLSVKDFVSIYDLAEEKLIVYPQQCDIRNSILEAYHSHNLDPKLDLEVAFGESIPGFIMSGAGISILPEIIAKHIDPSALKAVPITSPGLTRVLSLVTLKPEIGKKIYRLLK